MNSDNRSGPPRPTDHRYSAPSPAPAAPPAPEPEAESAAPKLIEVDLVRKYCPHWLVLADGSLRQNVVNPLENIPPGVVSLHPDDAGIVLENGIAHATRNTFRDLK